MFCGKTGAFPTVSEDAQGRGLGMGGAFSPLRGWVAPNPYSCVNALPRSRICLCDCFPSVDPALSSVPSLSFPTAQTEKLLEIGEQRGDHSRAMVGRCASGPVASTSARPTSSTRSRPQTRSALRPPVSHALSQRGHLKTPSLCYYTAGRG